MAQTPSYLNKVHLHPLTFALDALDKLDSLSLSLVQFHLDNDEPGFDQTLGEARKTWITRRQRAAAAGERFEGEPAPSSLPSRPASAVLLDRVGGSTPSYPPLFHPIVETLRYLHTQHERPLKSQVGLELKKRHPNVYSRDPELNTFKTYVAEAERRGVVRSTKGGNGRDWIVLQAQYMSGLGCVPSPPALPPPLAAKPPLPSPLPPSLFHLSDLTFPWTLATVSALPSHQLLLLQFRDDVLNLAGTAAGKAVHEAIEEEFWKRRSASDEAGEEWQDPPSSSFIPRSDFSQAQPSAPVSSSVPFASRASSVPPSYPDLRSPVPRSLASKLHTVEVGNLPPTTISDVRVLISILGPRLPPSAAILYRSDQRNPSAPPCRRAHVAYGSSGLAGAAQAHLTSLNLDENGARYLVTASLLDAAHPPPKWEWGDVLEPARTEMWRAYSAEAATFSEGKRQRDGGDQEDDYSKKRKVDRPKEPPRHVSPSSLVPTSTLSRLYGVAFSFRAAPPAVKQYGTVDDAFVHRFGAVAWREEPADTNNGMRYVLLFSSGRDASKFQRWVHDVAVRFWKFNGTQVDDLGTRDVQRSEGHYRDFSPEWRAEHNVILEGPVAKTVGEFGKGRNVAPDERVGFFPFEYVFNGLPQPLPAAGAALAARFAPLSDDDNRWSRNAEKAESVRSASRAPSERPHSPPPALASRLSPSLRASSAVASPDHRSASPASSHHPSADSSASLLPAPPASSSSALFVRGTANGHPSSTFATSDNDPEIALASPLSSISSVSAAPVLARQQQDEPSFSGPSALSIARLSPTITLDASKAGRSSRSRRPTAMDLNDFEQDLDQLFAGAEGLIGTNPVQAKEEEEDAEMAEAVVKQEAEEEDKPIKTDSPFAAQPVSAAASAEEDVKPTISSTSDEPFKDDFNATFSASSAAPAAAEQASSTNSAHSAQPSSAPLAAPTTLPLKPAGENLVPAPPCVRSAGSIPPAAPVSTDSKVPISQAVDSPRNPVQHQQHIPAPLSRLPALASSSSGPHSAPPSPTFSEPSSSAPFPSSSTRSMRSASPATTRKSSVPAIPSSNGHYPTSTPLTHQDPSLVSSASAPSLSSTSFTLSSEPLRLFPPSSSSSSSSPAPSAPLPAIPPPSTAVRAPFALPARPAPGAAPPPVDSDIPGGFIGGKGSREKRRV